MKILFTLPNGKEVLSNQRWINTAKQLITEISDNHLRNIRLWLHNQREAEIAVYGVYGCKSYNGFSYAEWIVIMKKEEARRLKTKETAKAIVINKAERELASMQELINKLKNSNLEDWHFKIN
jgi:hypothetical protein